MRRILAIQRGAVVIAQETEDEQKRNDGRRAVKEHKAGNVRPAARSLATVCIESARIEEMNTEALKDALHDLQLQKRELEAAIERVTASIRILETIESTTRGKIKCTPR